MLKLHRLPKSISSFQVIQHLFSFGRRHRGSGFALRLCESNDESHGRGTDMLIKQEAMGVKRGAGSPPKGDQDGNGDALVDDELDLNPALNSPLFPLHGVANENDALCDSDY